MRTALVGAAVALSFGCATTAPHQQPPPEVTYTDVELSVKDVDAEMLSELQAAFGKVPELKSAQLKGHANRVAVFDIKYPGDPGRLPKTLASIPHPGLRYGTAQFRAEYAAFDNLPPTIAFVHPQAEQVLAAKEQFATVEVPDKDLASVTISGKSVPPYKGNLYRLKLELIEGRQELVATAKDKAGNETSVRVAVVVDTTPPSLNAQIKIVVEGTVEPDSTVLIDGAEVTVERDGRYRAEVPVRKGQRKVEIVAIDRSGNKKTEVKTLGE